jgi:G:T-mismatch repair DNA endonuclease (very short patch repair protein)
MFKQQYLEKLKTHFNDDVIQHLSQKDTKFIRSLIGFKDNLKNNCGYEYDTKSMNIDLIEAIKHDFKIYKDSLIANNKNEKIITEERFIVFLRDKILAKELYIKFCIKKTNKMREVVTENPLLCDTSLNGFIARNGVEIGTEKYYTHLKNKRESSLRRISGWMKKGYSEEESKIMLSKHQTTFSLDLCIKKYGYEVGVRVWKERQDRWQATLNSKSPEEIDAITRSKVTNRPGGPSSKPEKELYDILCRSFINLEQQFVLRKGKTRFVYDFRFNNKLIEFNGTYWHCDPRKYEPDFFRKDCKLYAKEIWEKDKNKTNLAKENGFDVLVVWELDFKQNKEEVIKQCINFFKCPKD